MAVRWSLAHPLSATSVMIFLAERGVAVSKRTSLRWVQTFGPLLAAEIRTHRRRPGRRWWVDEVFFFRNKRKEKRSLYRAIDEHGQVLDILFRDRRATEAATAFFRRARRHTGSAPPAVRRPPSLAIITSRTSWLSRRSSRRPRIAALGSTVRTARRRNPSSAATCLPVIGSVLRAG